MSDDELESVILPPFKPTSEMTEAELDNEVFLDDDDGDFEDLEDTYDGTSTGASSEDLEDYGDDTATDTKANKISDKDSS